jgi:ABC-type glycerol-3-phosphate transport system substrate-binding protein
MAGCPRARETTSAKPVITFWSTEGYQPEEVAVLQALAREFSERDGTAVKIEFFTWRRSTANTWPRWRRALRPTSDSTAPTCPCASARTARYCRSMTSSANSAGSAFFPVPRRGVPLSGTLLVGAVVHRGAQPADPHGLAGRVESRTPTTWDEWVRVCAAMTRDTDGDGAIDRWGFGMYGNDHFGQSWIPFAAQNGGGLFAADGSITVATPENVAALAWYGDLYRKHRVTPPGTKSATWIDANLYYKRGLVGSLITNAYLLKELRADAPEVLAASRFYPIPVPRAGVRSRSYLGGSHLMVFRDAPHVDAARRFVRFLLDRDNYLRFLKSVEGGALPVFRDVASDPFFSDDPNLSVLIDQIAGAVRHPHRDRRTPRSGQPRASASSGGRCAKCWREPSPPKRRCATPSKPPRRSLPDMVPPL